MTKNQKIIGGVILGILVAGGLYLLTRPRVDYTVSAGPRPYRGNSQATVVIEEFSDFQCPACKRVAPLIKSIEERYGYQVKIVFKHFPLTSIHQYALRAAVAAECANDQGKFWEYHDALYDRQSEFSNSFFKELATELNLDTASFNACLDTKTRLDVVRADMREGEDRQVSATPTIFVNGQAVSIGDLEAVIGALVNK